MSRFIFAVLLTAIFVHCDLFISEEHRVFNVIRKGERAVEKENLPVLRQIVSEDYQDDWAHDYERLMYWFEAYFQRYDNIQVIITSYDISVKQNLAVCKIKVRIYGIDMILNEPTGDEIYLNLYLEKYNKKWIIIQARKSDQDVTE